MGLEPQRQKPPRFEAIKKRHTRAYADWTEEEDALLRGGLEAGASVVEIARALGRRPSAVKSRIARLSGPSTGSG